MYCVPINRKEFRAFRRISLLYGRVPTNSNHQIYGVVDGYDVANELWVDFESADETFANSRDESCGKKKRKARIIKHAEYLWIDETAITTASESVKEKKKKMGDSTQK